VLWIKAFHIVAMVAWFAGLFYLPRLYVYHAEAQDLISIKRFKVMARRLYFGIMWPAAILTTLLGGVLLVNGWVIYQKAGWMHAKLALVVLLWGYHLSCGHFRRAFVRDENQKSSKFFRVFNELPTFLLISIVCLVVVKPL
jgi:putative membrane protein